MNHFLLILAVVVPAASAEPNQKDLQDAELPKDGTTCLFIGHSFFIPVAKSFDQHAKLNGFSKHKQLSVFSGGQSGTVGSLWKNKKHSEKIKTILKSGKIQLLGMTVGGITSSFDDYKRWIDFALEHNPKTKFMVGLCWGKGGPNRKAKEFTEANLKASQTFFEMVTKLRKAFPKNSITLINYGAAACELKVQFEAGKLKGDISKMVDRKSGLFTDNNLGHAGPMIKDLSALIWLKKLYGADFDKLKLTRKYKTDLKVTADQITKAQELSKEMLKKNPKLLKESFLPEHETDSIDISGGGGGVRELKEGAAGTGSKWRQPQKR